jgi:hypothetical protein
MRIGTARASKRIFVDRMAASLEFNHKAAKTQRAGEFCEIDRPYGICIEYLQSAI